MTQLCIPSSSWPAAACPGHDDHMQQTVPHSGWTLCKHAARLQRTQSLRGAAEPGGVWRRSSTLAVLGASTRALHGIGRSATQK